MRDGIYRMQYQTSTLNAIAVIVLNDGVLSGCDRFHFMFGDYCQRGNRLNGTINFERHTGKPGPGIPEQFKIVFDGVGSDAFGQLDVDCPDIPQIRGHASFTWLAGFTAG